jgi:uncharacterized protein YehS (DUF1456 family)
VIWINDDFPTMLRMQDADFRAQAQAEADKRTAKVEERKAAAAREFAQLSAQHPITGYDRNIVRQWIEAGACGKRPALSFELHQDWKSEEERAIEDRARQLKWAAQRKEADAARVALLKAKAAKSEKVLMDRKWWDAGHQAAAQKREQRKGLVKARREAEEAERQEQKRRDAMRTAIIKKLRQAGGTKAAILALDEEEFSMWSTEIASADQLEAFGADLFRDGVKLREEDGMLLWRWVRGLVEVSARL